MYCLPHRLGQHRPASPGTYLFPRSERRRRIQSLRPSCTSYGLRVCSDLRSTREDSEEATPPAWTATGEPTPPGSVGGGASGQSPTSIQLLPASLIADSLSPSPLPRHRIIASLQECLMSQRRVPSLRTLRATPTFLDAASTIPFADYGNRCSPSTAAPASSIP
jgi:hypothetical protein